MLSRNPANTLLLRYETLIAADAAVLDAIGDFIGIPWTVPFESRFAKRHERNPVLYGHGNNEPGIAEIEQNCSALF